MITIKQPTHVRYEPDIDGGTTYAFNYRVGQLVTGRRPMWEMVRSIEAGPCDLDGLLRSLVKDDSEDKYGDEVTLLTDLTRLVEAEVLFVERNDS